MDFGLRLKEARKHAGITQQQLADILGVAKSTVAGYESGNREPDFFKIKLIAQTLSIDADYLLGIKRNYFPTTKEEQEHLYKYRIIDTKGKHTVDTVLEMEYNRCKAGDNSKVVALKPVDDKSHLIPDAAHRRTDLSEEELNDNTRNKHDDDIMNDPNF